MAKNIKKQRKSKSETPFNLQKTSLDIWLGRKEPETDFEKQLKLQIEEIKAKGGMPEIPWDPFSD